jgi:hypothetical protein
MNMNYSPSPEQLAAVFASARDEEGNHVLWIDVSGEVWLTTLPANVGPVAFEHEMRASMQVRYSTLGQGNDYVGPAAAQDRGWVAQVFASLLDAWTVREPGKVRFIE